MISVAMTTYNGYGKDGLYLRKQIDSILEQTYKGFELIICDDNSSDSTYEFLFENYASRDARIKLYKNKNNLGFKKNFEQAISLCSGDYIALSDQDDIWLPWKLEESLRMLKNYDLVCSNSKLINELDEYLGYTMKESVGYCYVPKNKKICFKFLLYKNFVQGSTLLGKREFLQKCIPIPDNFEYHDRYFALRACLENGICYIDKPSILYRQHTGQVTENKKAESFNKQVLKAFSKKSELEGNNFLKYTQVRLDFLKNVKTLPELHELSNEKYLDYVIQYENYLEKMKVLNKDFSTFIYFCINYQQFFLDKSLIKKSIRIIRRFLGWVVYVLSN